MPHKAWLRQNKEFFTPRDLLFLEKNSLHLNITALEDIKQRYLQGEPMAYLLGKEEFYGMEFKVDSRVLIPRPETELLVEKAIDLIKKHTFKNILDIGCGSGVIPIVLKQQCPRIAMTACDISADALALAQENSVSHKTDIEFAESDLFSAFSGRKFGLIVSNPPYVADRDKSVELSFEPEKALYAGVDGLDCIKRILNHAPQFLTDLGYLLIEFGYDQKSRIEEYITKIDAYDEVSWTKDLQGHDRLVCLKLKNRYNNPDGRA